MRINDINDPLSLFLIFFPVVGRYRQLRWREWQMTTRGNSQAFFFVEKFLGELSPNTSFLYPAN